jgi:hypothetical protein
MIPGAFWVTLIVGLSAALQQYFDAPWVPVAVLALGVVAKALEVWLKPTPVGVRGLAEEPSAWWRFLLG